MRPVLRTAWILLVPVLLVTSTPAVPESTARLAFQVDEGRNLNRFVRDGAVAAHLVLRSGADPRILVVFPAGDSGVGAWFAHQPRSATWSLDDAPVPISQTDGQGRVLRGLTVHATLVASELRVRDVVLSSVRVLRDFEQLGHQPALVAAAPPTVSGKTMTWARNRLDGAPGYRLSLTVIHGELVDGNMRAAADGRIGLEISGLSGEPPLQPLKGPRLLKPTAAADRGARDTLRFLAYREKLLAGSWRFDTYFGRDTLMSVRLLMPVLADTAVEDALASVLDRLSDTGEVAHEEDIGEQAILDHLHRDGSRSATPVYDYKMIDGDFLLPCVAGEWLLGTAGGRREAAAFLRAGTRGAALVANLRYVLRAAAPFAQDPKPTHLVGLKLGFAVGDWRDSESGLGGGHFPFDVNAVLVPAALAAAAALQRSGLLSPYETSQDRALFAPAADWSQTWRDRAPPLFDVALPESAARSAITRYATAQAIPAAAALDALQAADLRFHALALDARGSPIPVMQSDEGFALLFARPEPAALDRAVTTLMRPFPAGLMTPVGLLVANPAFAPSSLQASLDRNAYHGTVVWSWQQALFAAGLARQLERRDLPATVRTHLTEAQRTLWRAVQGTQALNNSELWSWTYTASGYQVVPFGQNARDADESNAAQLWSTVYLAVRPPRRDLIR